MTVRHFGQRGQAARVWHIQLKKNGPWTLSLNGPVKFGKMTQTVCSVGFGQAAAKIQPGKTAAKVHPQNRPQVHCSNLSVRPRTGTAVDSRQQRLAFAKGQWLGLASVGVSAAPASEDLVAVMVLMNRESLHGHACSGQAAQRGCSKATVVVFLHGLVLSIEDGAACTSK